MQAIRGIYRNGRVELLEIPKKVRQSQVIVTFLDADIYTDNGDTNNRESLINSGEILTDDLTQASAEIAADFNRAIEKSALELEN